MATLSINESREYIIFQAFAKNEKFKDALTALEEYDEKHPETLIFRSADDKKDMRRSFDVFKAAEKTATRGSGNPDYDDPVMLERVKTILTQSIFPYPAVTINEYAQGMATRRANIGSILYNYAKLYKTIDQREKQRMAREANAIKHEQALTAKSGRTDHGGYDGRSVISQRSGNGDKSMHQILVERGLSERA